MRFLGLEKSADGIHKYEATFENEGRQKVVKFGAKGMKDFTLFSPAEREE